MTGAHSHVDVPASRRTRLLLALLLAPFVGLTALGLVALWPSSTHVDLEDFGPPEQLFDASIVELHEGPCQGTPTEADLACSQATVQLNEGPDAGNRRLLAEQPTTATQPLEVGDHIVLAYFPNSPPEFQYAFADRQRRGPLYLLIGLFTAVVLVFGRWRGLRALIGLVVSGMVVIVFILPALLEANSPLAVALTGSAAIALVALYLAHGFTVATTTAVLGTLVSLGLVGFLGSVFVGAADFTGLATEEATYLQLTAGQIDLQGLLLAGIVIGALGVLDDVTVTQVSAVWELRRANPALRRWDLYASAVRIGRDHIASTVNTLVLAYAGASLPLLLLFTQANQGLTDVLNGEAVAVEVVRALVGSIGLVCSVPITTALAAVVVTASTGAPASQASDPRRFWTRRERSIWGEAVSEEP